MRSFALPFVSAFLLSGCATVFNGTQQAVEVSSEPPGATATVGDIRVVTPGVIRLSRKSREVELHFSKEGFRDASFTLTRHTSNSLWLNLIAIPVGAAGGAAVGGSRSSNAFLGSLDNGVHGAVIGGLVLPVVAFGVDLASGAAYRLDPPHVHVHLQALEPQ